QRRGTRQHVLAEGGGGHDDVRMTLGQLGDLRGEDGGERGGILGALDRQYPGDAIKFGGFGGHGTGIFCEHGYVNVAADLLRAAHRAGGGGREACAIVLCNNENIAHFTTPLLLSSPTSS